MKQYLDLIKNIFKLGVKKKNRTSINCYSIFGYNMRFNIKYGFPMLTTKKLHLKSIIYELLWFIKGETNIKYLKDNGVSIWNSWADENGDLGPIYGFQWRNWFLNKKKKIDQLSYLIEQIKKNPDSRRLIISSWNVSMLKKMSIPPCHVLFQFYVNKNKLSLQLYQRSCDVFLGLPFNIASYSLLLMMIAKVTNLEAFEFIHTIGDAHIYENHIKQVKLQLERKPKLLPKMIINSKSNIFDFEYQDFLLKNYNPYPHIKGYVSI